MWMSLIAFWGILFFYTGVGAHHLLWAPIPYWLKTIAVAESFGMVIPVLAFMFNILLTMRGNWSHVRSSVPLLYALTGWAAYIIVSFQGSNQALRGVNELTHFTLYVPGHAMLALMFFGASTCIAGAYYIIPRVFGCRLYSRRLARAQYALYVVGFAAFFIGFFVGGAVQGSSWVHGGLPIWSVLAGLRPWSALRIMGGTLIVTSFMMFAWNVFATMIVRKPYIEPDLNPEPTFRTPGAKLAGGDAS
jgi:cbb3-type cytochrome oxidase subunit 1